MFSKKKEKNSNEESQENEPVKQEACPSHSSKEVTVSQEEYDKLKADSKQLEELKDKLLRQAADLENSKKRFTREKEEFLKYANERLISEFLPILDNMDRALNHAKQHQDSREAVLEGVEIIRKHLYEMLKSHGLERQVVLGKKFDPHQHEALGVIEDKNAEEDTILEELEGGYTYQGRLLRPAKVRVSKGGKAASVEEKDADIT